MESQTLTFEQVKELLEKTVRFQNNNDRTN